MQEPITIEEVLDAVNWLDGFGLIVTDDDLLTETLEEAGYKHEVEA